MTSPEENSRLYQRFAEALNQRRYDVFDELMAQDFVDHHPGLVDVASLDVYKKNLAYLVSVLEMIAIPENVLSTGDKVFTRIKLTGRQVGAFFGVEATNSAVSWYTHELWRVDSGKFVERWAIDDLYSLLAQMGVALPSWG